MTISDVQRPARTAVILAAGQGKRLRPLTDDRPKGMVELGGEPLLRRLARELGRIGVERIVFVTGYRPDAIASLCALLSGAFAVECVHSEDFATTNNIVSLWRLSDRVREDFLLLESDLVLRPGVLRGIGLGSAAVLSHTAPWMDGTVATLGSDGKVARMILKAEGAAPPGALKTVNVYRIEGKAWISRVWPALDEAVRGGNVTSYYEMVFAKLIREGTWAPRAVVWSPDDWREVDTPQDLAEAEAWHAGHAPTGVAAGANGIPRGRTK